jgi:hypothetical protein
MFEHVREGKPPPAAELTRRPGRRALTRSVAVQRAKPEVGLAGGLISDELATEIRSSGAGQPLPAPVRQPMERAFGADLSAVRIHPRSDVAPRLAASAFTVAQDIHFAPGEYHPETERGRFMLAHELAHTVQTAPGARIRRKVGFEYEFGEFNTQAWGPRSGWVPHTKGAVIKQRPGFQVTADEATGGGSRLEIIVKEIDETNPGERATLTGVTVPAITALLTQLAQVAGPQVGQWVTTDQFPLLGGSTWHRIRSVQPPPADAGDVSGQLQLTAGLSMAKLADMVSGQQAVNYPAANQGRFDWVMDRYRPALGGGMWGFAQGQVNGNAAFNALTQPQRDQLAALVALMANVPINVRTANNIEYPKATAGALLARTDFSKIALSLPDQVKAVLTPALMETLLVGTINQVPAIGGAVAAGHDVFPAGMGFIPTVPNLAGLTIGSWARSVVPTAGSLWGWWQGKDQLTKANYPGPHGKWMESMGAFGSNVDPGAKPIFEFRTLNTVFGDELTAVITDLLGYLLHP